MARTIWYISKYGTPTYAGKVGARGFLLLREMVRLGYRCVMMCSDSNHLAAPPALVSPTFKEDVSGVEVHWIRTRKYDNSSSAGRIFSWLDFELRLWRMPKKVLPKPDVVIVSSLSLLTVLNGLWLRWRYRCKLVFEVRDIWPLTLQELRQLPRWHPAVCVLGLIEWLGYRFSDVIVGTMPNLGEHVRNVLGYSRPVGCVPQGIDEALFDPMPLPPDFAERYLPSDKFIVAYAGSIGMANALSTLFEAAKQMIGHEGIHFLILGDGFLKGSYQAQSADLTNVTFAPQVPKTMVQSVLKHCDLLYFSSPKSRLLRFGQSLNKLIDYQLSGKPVLASYSGFPSMLNEAGCGSFVPSGDVVALCDEILRYSKLPASERKAMGDAGRDWVLRYRRFPALARHYISLIDEGRTRDSLAPDAELVNRE